MALTYNERLVVAIANALTVYSIRCSESAIPPSTTPHGFVRQAVPDDMKHDITAAMIDDVFAAIAHGPDPSNGS